MNAAVLAEPSSSAVPVQATPTLRIQGLSKQYGQHLALAGVTLDLEPGEVHVLFGENGAGKSTLISMLAGAREPSAGHIEIGGWCGVFGSVSEARARGVRAVFQEFSLVPTLTVAENITLGEEPTFLPGVLSPEKARQEARDLIAELGFELEVDDLVSSLPRGKQQMVEICKALRGAPKVLILDEPTASLSEHDAQSLFALVRRLKANGTTIIYITHRMHEIPLLADRVTVLRDGLQIATVCASTPEAKLIELMTGRTLSDIYPTLGESFGAVHLELEDLSLAPEPGAAMVRDVRLSVRAGEIVGVAGLVGCGKSELAQACFGLRRLDGGRIILKGKEVRLHHPADAIARGLWYSPSDRKTEGLALDLSAASNMGLSGLRFGPLAGRFLKPRREKRAMVDIASRIEFDARRLREPAANFSGGNQQKVLLGKGLAQKLSVYVFDEPTVGVDVGARQSIYRVMAELSAAGAAILLVSSDLPELLGMTHRLVVMSGGLIVSEFKRAEYDEQKILKEFF